MMNLGHDNKIITSSKLYTSTSLDGYGFCWKCQGPSSEKQDFQLSLAFLSYKDKEENNTNLNNSTNNEKN